MRRIPLGGYLTSAKQLGRKREEMPAWAAPNKTLILPEMVIVFLSLSIQESRALILTTCYQNPIIRESYPKKYTFGKLEQSYFLLI